MRKIFILLLVVLSFAACKSKNVNSEVQEVKSIYTNLTGNGAELLINFEIGEAHNYPSFAIWIEDVNGKYIETLYITKSVGTGIFNYGKPSKGDWKPDQKRYPSSLPYWSHKRGVKAEDGLYIPDSSSKVVDGITGATPQTSFKLYTKLTDEDIKKFKLLVEVNQTWDFNEYWTNNKYPDNEAYKRSCQPAVIYEAIIDLNKTPLFYDMNAVGHSHYAGETGEIFTDLKTLTTALQIFKTIQVQLKN